MNADETRAWILAAAPSAGRRHLYGALALSLCIHAILLAMHWAGRPATAPRSTVLEVTLVNARTQQAPLQPTLLAQEDLNGGGTQQRGVGATPLPRTVADSPDQVVLEALRRRQEQLEREQQRLLTQLHAERSVPAARKSPDMLAQSPDAGQDSLDQQSMVVNAQIAAIKERIELYNARPRQQFVGPSTKAVEYARYVEAWRKRIELLGTEHYPDEARGRIYGKLQMTVYIGRNGELIRTEINQPSEHAILNLAAQRIVQLAAPFSPLPPEIAGNTDVLAITRTWHFLNNELHTDTP